MVKSDAGDQRFSSGSIIVCLTCWIPGRAGVSVRYGRPETQAQPSLDWPLPPSLPSNDCFRYAAPCTNHVLPIAKLRRAYTYQCIYHQVVSTELQSRNEKKKG